MAKMRLPNGYGNISKLSGKRRNPYRVRVNDGFTEDGKVKWINVGYYRTHSDAKKALDDFHNDPLARKEKITIGEIYEILKESVFPTKAANTVSAYSSSYNIYVSEIAHRPIADVSLKELEQLFKWRTKATQNTMKSVVGLIYSYAMRHEFIIRDYSQYIDLKNIVKAPTKEQERREFNKKEIERVWEDYQNGVEEAKYALVYLHTGMRKEELARTTILNENHMIVDGTKNENAKMRKVPIHDVLKPFIYDLDFNYDTYQVYLYLSKFGQMVHNCRHSFITQSTRLLLPDTHVNTMTGHGEKTVKDRYTHLNFEDLEPVMKAFHYPSIK